MYCSALRLRRAKKAASNSPVAQASLIASWRRGAASDSKNLLQPHSVHRHSGLGDLLRAESGSSGLLSTGVLLKASPLLAGLRVEAVSLVDVQASSAAATVPAREKTRRQQAVCEHALRGACRILDAEAVQYSLADTHDDSFGCTLATKRSTLPAKRRLGLTRKCNAMGQMGPTRS